MNKEYADITAEQIIDIINKYNELTREELIHNVKCILEPLEMSFKEQKMWVAEISGFSRDTVNSWFAPGRESKVPLVALAKISKELNGHFCSLLNHPAPEDVKSLRIRKESPNYKSIVAELYLEHPDFSSKMIAEKLSITDHTVRRHIHFFQNICLEKNLSEINKLIIPFKILEKDGLYEFNFDVNVQCEMIQLIRTIQKESFLTNNLEIHCDKDVMVCCSKDLIAVSLMAFKVKRNMYNQQIEQTETILEENQDGTESINCVRRKRGR